MKKLMWMIIVGSIVGSCGSMTAQETKTSGLEKQIVVDPSGDVADIHFEGLAANVAVKFLVVNQKGKVMRSKFLFTGKDGAFTTWIDDYSSLRKGKYTLKVMAADKNSDEMVLNLN